MDNVLTALDVNLSKLPEVAGEEEEAEGGEGVGQKVEDRVEVGMRALVINGRHGHGAFGEGSWVLSLFHPCLFAY